MHRPYRAADALFARLTLPTAKEAEQGCHIDNPRMERRMRFVRARFVIPRHLTTEEPCC